MSAVERGYIIRGEWTGTEYLVDLGEAGSVWLRRCHPSSVTGGELIEGYYGPMWLWLIDRWARRRVKRIERLAWKLYQLKEGDR